MKTCVNYKTIGKNKSKNYPNDTEVLPLFGILHSPDKKQTNEYPNKWAKENINKFGIFKRDQEMAETLWRKRRGAIGEKS